MAFSAVCLPLVLFYWVGDWKRCYLLNLALHMYGWWAWMLCFAVYSFFFGLKLFTVVIRLFLRWEADDHYLFVEIIGFLNLAFGSGVE